MKLLLISVSLLNFLSYLWSVIGLFKRGIEQQKFQYKLLQVNSFVLWLCLLLAIYNSEKSNICYASLSMFQFFLLYLFWMQSKIVRENEFSIVFSKDKPKKLVKIGLYRYVRHPFYAIYILCYLSIALVMLDIVSIFLTLLIFVIYYRAASFEELKFHNSILSLDYSEYKKNTGMFFPKI